MHYAVCRLKKQSPLPESASEEISIRGVKAGLTVFRQLSPHELEGKVLVTVLVARPRLLGMSTHHLQKGLDVFGP